MVDAPFQPEKLPEIGPKPVQGPQGLGPDEKEFQSLMQEKTTGEISPLQVSNKKTAAEAPSMEGLLKQLENADGMLKKFNNILQFPQLKLKESHKRLLNTKLKNAMADIDGAAKASKTKILEKTDTSNMQPVAKFISFVGDGHSQLSEARNNLSEMVKKKKQITPANMLLMQVKIAQAQQEIEFSSILLSKVVEGIRQTLNIQIQ